MPSAVMASTGGHLASVVHTARHQRRRSAHRSPPSEVFHEEFDAMPEADRQEVTRKVASGIRCVDDFFSEDQCRQIEEHIDGMTEQSKRGLFRPFTVDKSPLRCKFFFGEGYTYGSQLERKGPGMEKLYPLGEIDAIPKWIKKLVVRPLEKAKIIRKGWVNSAVVNDYQPGGCIVSHVDPMHIFDRPIVSCSFLSDCALSFGCKFAFRPIRTSRPVHVQKLPRGCVTTISGFAADGITHCVRPQDVVSRRAVVILRRVLPSAPRLLPEEMAHFQQHHMGQQHHTGQQRQPSPSPLPPRRRRRRHRSSSPDAKRQRLNSTERVNSREHNNSRERINSRERLNSMERINSRERLNSMERINSRERINSTERERDKERHSHPLPSGRVPHCYADLEEQEDEEEKGEEEGEQSTKEEHVEAASEECEGSEERLTAGSVPRKRNYRKRSN